MDSLIGQTLGQYEIRAKIGSGGMATVYRARQLSVDRDVAIKIIRPDLVEEQGFTERFQREARTIAALSHLHILKVFDYGHERGLSYLVMELLEGGSLSKRVRSGGPLAIPDASRMLDQIAAALDYAHQRGVIHRDLKPDNVLLDKDGNAFLTDFGIAKLLNESTGFTRTGMIMGTPSYMAPELWSGQPADTRTDNYALGVILFEMLTGTSPFLGDTPYRIMHMHIYEPPPAASAQNKALPPAVDEVLHKALAKEPDSRFVSAGQLAAAFRAVATGAPVPAVPSGQWSGVLTAAEPAPRPPSPPRGTQAGASPAQAAQVAQATPSSGGRPPTLPHQPLATVEAEPPRRSRALPALLLGGVVLVALIVIGALALSASQGNNGAATSTPAALVPSATPGDAVIVVPASETATATLTFTPTLTMTESHTATSAPRETPSLTPSLMPSLAPSVAQLPTLTSAPSETASATATASQTASPTPTASVTPSMTPTLTATPSVTDLPSATFTATVGIETIVAATLSARDTATAFAQGVIATVNAVNTQSAAPKATLAVQQTRTAIQATIDAVQTVARATVNAQLTAVAATAFARPTSTNTPFIPTSVFGATVTPYGFASPTPVNCPGFLPSRLSIGQTARVTPGDPNRLRQTPGTGSAHPVVTQVPGGGVIRVLEGPVCTVESGGGVAWWRVEWYDASAGRTYTGWTAEGMGTTYWVEPWTP